MSANDQYLDSIPTTVTDASPRLLTAEDLLTGGLDELKRVEIPQLGGVVFIQPLSAGRVLDFIAIPEGKKRDAALLALVAHSIVNQNGDRLFTSEHALRLRNMRADVFNKLAGAVTEGFSDKSAKSESDTGSGSGSGTGSGSGNLDTDEDGREGNA